MAAISLYTNLSVKVLRGVVPVREDGSAQFVVPANRNIFFQALDEDFMEIQRMRTFVNFQPGERRSCIGCHENRSHAPANRRPLAMDYPPVRLQAQPGDAAPRPLHYPTDVQPIFDRHCTSCHNEKRRDGGLDLSGGMTESVLPVLRKPDSPGHGLLHPGVHRPEAGRGRRHGLRRRRRRRTPMARTRAS